MTRKDRATDNKNIFLRHTDYFERENLYATSDIEPVWIEIVGTLLCGKMGLGSYFVCCNFPPFVLLRILFNVQRIRSQ